jgi:hypothetical protein
MELLAIVLSEAGESQGGGDGGADLTNVQYKPIWTCHNKSPLYNEHILMKKLMGKPEFSNQEFLFKSDRLDVDRLMSWDKNLKLKIQLRQRNHKF